MSRLRSYSYFYDPVINLSYLIMYWILTRLILANWDWISKLHFVIGNIPLFYVNGLLLLSIYNACKCCLHTCTQTCAICIYSNAPPIRLLIFTCSVSFLRKKPYLLLTSCFICEETISVCKTFEGYTSQMLSKGH